MQYFKKYKILFALAVLVLPLSVMAAILPDCALTKQTVSETGSNLCSLCDIIQTGMNIFRYILGLIGGLSLVLFVWHGFGWISSMGNSEKIEASKKGLFNTVIGIVLILASWTIVNMVINLLLIPEDTPFSQIPATAKIFGQPWNLYCEGTKVNSALDENSKAPIISAPNRSGGPTIGVWNGWNYRYIDPAQFNDASASLLTLLSCYRSQLNAQGRQNIGMITSISDDNYIGRLDLCKRNQQNPACAHSIGSCHYGDTTNDGKSHAVDFGDYDEGINSTYYNLAQTICGGVLIVEDDHGHVSTNDCRARY